MTTHTKKKLGLQLCRCTEKESGDETEAGVPEKKRKEKVVRSGRVRDMQCRKDEVDESSIRKHTSECLTSLLLVGPTESSIPISL